MYKALYRLAGAESEFRSPTRTFVVTGSSRGGTSMVSLALRGLGIDMGRGLADNHEDLDFYSLLHVKKVVLDPIRRLVEKRDTESAVWGFKSPLLLEMRVLSDVVALLRRPIVILVFRNPLAIAESRFRRDGDPAAETLMRLQEMTADIGKFLQTASCPVLGVNYEAAAQQPAAFMSGLAELFGLQVGEPERLAAELISGDGGGYRTLPSERLEASIRDMRPDEVVLEPLEPVAGSAVHLERHSVRYEGNIFSGDDNLVLLSARDGGPRGARMAIRIDYPPCRSTDKTNSGHNVYFGSADGFSLGRSAFVSREMDGRVLEVCSGTPLTALAAGIASDDELGLEKDFPAFSLLGAVDNHGLRDVGADPAELELR